MNDELLQRERVMMAVMNRPRAVIPTTAELLKEAAEVMAFIRQPVALPPSSHQSNRAA